MKTLAQCPYCQGEHITVLRPSVDLLFALGMSITGLGLLIPALSQSFYSYIIAFPFCLTGALGAYKSIKHSPSAGYCSNCKQQINSL